jgi:polyphosphate kinase 2
MIEPDKTLNTEALTERQRRFQEDLIDAYDEELELEVDDRRLDGVTNLTDEARASRKRYFRELFRLQGELVKMQDWVQHTGHRVVVIFEGRDAAGKGGMIKRITQRLNPRVCRVAALPAPNNRERTQWYFQRYAQHLPAGGEIVLFDRSWYNRAGVERVMGFCTDEEYEEFFRSVPEFERMLVRSGIQIIKYWFSITDDEQEVRFQARVQDPLKQWKLSPMDLESRRRWEAYTRVKEGAMVGRTGCRQEACAAELHDALAQPGPVLRGRTPSRGITRARLQRGIYSSARAGVHDRSGSVQVICGRSVPVDPKDGCGARHPWVQIILPAKAC